MDTPMARICLVTDSADLQSDEDSFFGYSGVKFIIQKRDNVERTKEVVLPQQ